MTKKKFLLLALLSVVTFFFALSVISLRPLPRSLAKGAFINEQPRILDRKGRILKFENFETWNTDQWRVLSDLPPDLQELIVFTEDRNFFDHHGVDWRAKLAAIWQNVSHAKIVRGASSITEQVVRIIHRRPRTFWSKWVEMIEAYRVENKYSKLEILEFYLNQLPFARGRRGISDAAKMYFNRDLQTLSLKEKIALAVLVRAPSRLDLWRNPFKVESQVASLSERLFQNKSLSQFERESLLSQRIALSPQSEAPRVQHFLKFAQLEKTRLDIKGDFRTSLDLDLQKTAQSLIDRAVKDLEGRSVSKGAILVTDNQTGEILAWVNAGDFYSSESGSQIDAILSPRQPGSTMKPFVYALALEKGLTPGSLLDDAPLQRSVGNGLHEFRNYSQKHYGPIRLREALGNSLNIPAVLAHEVVGSEKFLKFLRELGMRNLSEPASYYGMAAALGGIEISLFDLVQGYQVFSNNGRAHPLTIWKDEQRNLGKQLISSESSAQILNILSDPWARTLEFGQGHTLRFPFPVAIKTGTSTDYRDAWAVGISSRYTVGIWMGNLNRENMKEVTGSLGPALVLRSLMSELHRAKEAGPSPFSNVLKKKVICRESGLQPLKGCDCEKIEEWFRPTDKVERGCLEIKHMINGEPKTKFEQDLIRFPNSGLELAYDPRVPSAQQQMTIQLQTNEEIRQVEWFMNGRAVAVTKLPQFPWLLERGEHEVYAAVFHEGKNEPQLTPRVRFLVK